jgi:hypothetical protein
MLFPADGRLSTQSGFLRPPRADTHLLGDRPPSCDSAREPQARDARLRRSIQVRTRCSIAIGQFLLAQNSKPSSGAGVSASNDIQTEGVDKGQCACNA